MIFDTHAHYDDEQFDGDRDELLKSMPDLGVGTIVDVSATYESCEKVLTLAGKYPHVYAAIGVHPDEVGELNEDKIQHMKELCCNKKWLQSERSVWIIIGIMNRMRYSRSGLSASWSSREK